MENMNINIEMNMEMNEEVKKIARVERNQELKLQNARQHRDSMLEKQNEIEEKRKEMEETVELIKYYQQMLLACFMDKEDLLEDMNKLISEAQSEIESSKKTIVDFMYPEAVENLTNSLDKENFMDIVNSVSINSFTEQLKSLAIKLEQDRNDNN